MKWWENKKDEELCDWLYKTYVNELYSYGIAFGTDRAVLQDAIHDLFLHFIEKKTYLRDIENVKFYLFRALKNKLISVGRSSVFFENIDDKIDYTFALKVTSIDLLIEEEERVQLTKRVEELLFCLTNRQREAIYLRYIQELSYDEIGELLGMSPKASRKLVSRALIRIRENNFSVLFFLLLFKNTFS